MKSAKTKKAVKESVGTEEAIKNIGTDIGENPKQTKEQMANAVMADFMEALVIQLGIARTAIGGTPFGSMTAETGDGIKITFSISQA